MRTELVEAALKAARLDRANLGGFMGAIFHSDHRSVYTSKDYAKLCTQLGVTQSMGAVGSADNVLAESFNATLEREVLAGAATFVDEADARRRVFRCAVRYNTHRRQSWCGYLSPSTTWPAGPLRCRPRRNQPPTVSKIRAKPRPATCPVLSGGCAGGPVRREVT